MKFFLFLALSISGWAACTPDSRGICVTGLTAIQDNLLGPLIPDGASPWTFGDTAEKVTGTNLGSVASADPPILGTALPGTVSFSGGTTFATTADLTGSISLFQNVIVAWDSPDGAGTGRLVCPVYGITSTTITCGENYFVPNFSGKAAYLEHAAYPSGCALNCWITENPLTVWNYYDAGMGLYRLYYRTGTTAYQTYARAFADIQWQWVLDHGYRSISPRAGAMVSQFFRALDGQSGRFPYLYNWINLEIPSWATNSSYRESGYTLWDIALGAKTDPDATRHAQYCAWLATYTTLWDSHQKSDGGWNEDTFGENNFYISAPKNYTPPLQFVKFPWIQAIMLRALEAAYESLSDTDPAQGCNASGANNTLAANALTAITNGVIWQNNYGRDTTNRGIFYEVDSQSNEQQSVTGAGTADFSLASTAVLGHSTSWLTDGMCDGTHFIGPKDAATPRGVYKVTSCADNTHMVISVAYGIFGELAGISGSTIGFAPAASSTCGGSLATYCYLGAGMGDRNLTRVVCGEMAWLYAQTHNSTYLTWVDECISATLGGPSSGMTSAASIGSFVTPCSGPACDGYVGDFVSAAPSCTDTGGVAPCVYGSTIDSKLGKDFGEAFGAPGIDNALGWRFWFNNPPAAVVPGKALIPGKGLVP